MVHPVDHSKPASGGRSRATRRGAAVKTAAATMSRSLVGIFALSMASFDFGDAATLPTTLPTATTTIDYEKEGLTGTIPTQFGLLTEVNEMRLNQNQFSGTLPTQIGSLVLLTYWKANSNMLTGPVPSQYGSLSKIESSFYFQINSLSGTLPTQLGNVRANTAGFSFRYNSLNGTLPTELGNYVNLTGTFFVFDNSLSGAIPTEIGRWSSFSSSFNVYSNRLASLPTELGKMVALKKALRVEANSITSSLPSQFGSLVLLTSQFQLQSNALSGTLPTQLGRMTDLEKYFVVYDNDPLHGSIPSQFGNLVALSSYFDVYSTKVSGSIPTQLGGVSDMAVGFNFNDNMLTGALPSELASFASLKSYLYLHNNALSSTIPTELAAGLAKLTHSYKLGSNKITGTLPTEIGGLGLKTVLSLEGNALSGALPTQIGALTKMVGVVAMAGNSFSGALPTELGYLVKMTTYMNLFSNQFCGDMPTQLSALSSGFSGGFQVSTGNYLGTDCCEALPGSYTCAPSPLPTAGPTSSPSTSPPSSLPTMEPTYWCPDGTYKDDGGTCVSCAVGRYRFNNDTIYSTRTQNHEWMYNCSLCPNGKYNTKTGQSSCTTCASGKTSSDDRASCTDCWPGTFVENQTNCVDCPRGKYAPVALTGGCIDCNEGFETKKEVAASSCTACNAGYYSPGLTVNCSACTAGRYSSTQSPECTDCEEGHYAEEAAASSCLKCTTELGEAYTSESAAAGCVCKEGYFLYGSECKACPDGSVCPQGTTLEFIEVEKGYYRFDLSSPETYACPYPNNCPGGVGVAGDGDAYDDDDDGEHRRRRRLLSSTNATGRGASCIEGAGGPLCYVCDSSYFHSSWSNACVSCSSVAGEGWLGPLLIFLAVVAFVALVNFFRRPIRGWLNKNSRWLSTAWAKLVAFIVCMQIILVVSENHVSLGGVAMASPYQSFLDSIPVLNFEFTTLFLPFNCFSENTKLDHLSTLVGTTLLPILVFALLHGGLHFEARRARRKGHHMGVTARKLKRKHNLYKYVMMQAMILAYPMICRKICQSFRCDPYDIGGAYNFTAAATTTTSLEDAPVSSISDTKELRLLKYDPAIECASDRYYVLVAFALIAFLVYPFGVPLVLFFSLFRWRHHLNPPSYEDEYRAVRARRKDKKMMRDSAVLFALEYRPAYWWFEVWILVRRFLLTALLLVFEHLETCTLYVIFAVLGMLVLEREWSANLDAFLVNIQYSLNLQIMLAVLYMLLLDAGMLDGKVAAKDTTSILSWPVLISATLLVFNVTLVLFMGAAARHTIAKQTKMQDRLDKLHDQVVIDKQEDKNRFVKAWHGLVLTGGPDDEKRLLGTLKLLTERSALPTGKQPTPRQNASLASVDELLEEAEGMCDEFHEKLKSIVIQFGGEYQKGPNKSRARAVEKMENDYSGDHTKLVDVVRASGIFPNFMALTLAVEMLMSPECSLKVVRAKDRFNKPTDFGYKDMLLNIKLEHSDHIGELQLHLQPIIEVKPACHRTYALMRAVGWEDDNKEDDEESEEEEDEDLHPHSVQGQGAGRRSKHELDIENAALPSAVRSDSFRARTWQKRQGSRRFTEPALGLARPSGAEEGWPEGLARPSDAAGFSDFDVLSPASKHQADLEAREKSKAKAVEEERQLETIAHLMSEPVAHLQVIDPDDVLAEDGEGGEKGEGEDSELLELEAIELVTKL